MKLTFALAGALAAALLAQQPASGQDPNLKKELDLLKRENELLKREADLLKRENELLKQELSALKKGDAKAGDAKGVAEPITVTVGDVEYTYQGTTRNGQEVLITVLAKSTSGDHRAPGGEMTLVDDNGNKYKCFPQGGIGTGGVLKEGVPTKLVWRFGPGPFGGAGNPAPPAKVTKFASISIDPFQPGQVSSVEFRNVPATIAPPPKKK